MTTLFLDGIGRSTSSGTVRVLTRSVFCLSQNLSIHKTTTTRTITRGHVFSIDKESMAVPLPAPCRSTMYWMNLPTKAVLMVEYACGFRYDAVECVDIDYSSKMREMFNERRLLHPKSRCSLSSLKAHCILTILFDLRSDITSTYDK